MGQQAELAVLRTLRLKGRADVDGLVAATGHDADTVSAIATSLVESGGAREVGGHYMLLKPARERLEQLLDDERAAIDAAAMAELYEQFGAVNGPFKQLASDWQLKDGETNDHSDPAYDQAVLARLPAVHEGVVPILRKASALAPRLAPYERRLQTALERVQAGDHDWLLKPLIDSYHTVWFELHEDLIGLAGLTRQEEAASGRAD